MNTILEVIEDLKKGRLIILVDDEDRENEGDLLIAAEYIDAEKLKFMLRETTGFICISLAGEYLDRLNIPMMTQDNTNQYTTPFTMSVEAAHGVTTGVSIPDRLHTIRTLIADDSTPKDIVMPGHVMPLRPHKDGVLGRKGHTEGSIDLLRLAGCKPASILCEMMGEDGEMLRGEELHAFAKQHDIKITSVEKLREYRLTHENVVTKITETSLPIKDLGTFKLQVYNDQITNSEYSVLLKFPLSPEGTLVRVHSQCLTGDVFRSQRCDCGDQLDLSLKAISQEGGVLIYLPQEGRGIGLSNKIKSYKLQEEGLDSVQANHELGFANDLRDYYPAAQILRQLNLNQIALLSNNPDKYLQLTKYGIHIKEQKNLLVEPCDHNIKYLLTKQNKLNHTLQLKV